MRITANHLTVLRIISLPIPCILLYGGLASNVVALLLFAGLGFTDYLDGVLARRHGTTAFGTLFDPIADKIFITVIYIPFVQLGYIPLWTAFLLFLREFLITEARRLLSQRNLELRVTELAKSKTTIQMAGAAFILLVHLIPSQAMAIGLFAIPLAFTLVLAVWYRIAKGHVNHRISLAILCFGYILLIRLFFTPHWSALLYVIVIVGFTYASGLQYMAVSYSAWAELRGYPFLLLLRLVSSFVIPMVALAMLHFVPALSWAAILILSFDFASQGLDTWISTLGREERTKDRLKHLIIVPTALGVLVALSLFTEARTVATIFLSVSLALSTLYMLIDFYGHRKLLMVGAVSS